METVRVTLREADLAAEADLDVVIDLLMLREADPAALCDLDRETDRETLRVADPAADWVRDADSDLQKQGRGGGAMGERR